MKKYKRDILSLIAFCALSLPTSWVFRQLGHLFRDYIYRFLES
ncbi:hypothetical protein [Lewinella sp. IMCC34183]|nr:hypothetical protein [Lewinella sp. IMCC34183]